MEAFLDLVKDVWDFLKQERNIVAPLIITIILMGALIVLLKDP